MNAGGQRSAEEILEARARAFATAEKSATDGPMIDIVEFALGAERYGIETNGAAAIHPLEQLTPLPGTPPFIAGIINVRGRIIAVIDIKRFFELPAKGLTDLHRVIVLQDDVLEVGILADFIVGLRTIPLSCLQPALPTHTGIRRQYLKGITSDAVVVLDATRILADPKLIVDDNSHP